MNKEVIKIKLFDENYDCYLNIGRYQNNNRLYLGLDTKEEPFSDITINLPEYPCVDDYTIFVNGDVSTDVKKQLEKCGILSTYLYSVNYNLGNYDCYSVNMEKLKYYDPVGFEKANLKIYIDKDLEADIKI